MQDLHLESFSVYTNPNKEETGLSLLDALKLIRKLNLFYKPHKEQFFKLINMTYDWKGTLVKN